VESEFPVAAVHPNPYRFFLYLHDDHADQMNLAGVVNEISVVPEDGLTSADLKERLFGEPGVAAVEGVNEVARTIRDTFEDFLGFLNAIQGFVLLMAVLIAFNSTSISSDERRREHATMFAFGLPVRTVMLLTIVESLLIGILATLLGILFGRALITYVVRFLLPSTTPDLWVVVDVSARTYLTAALLGVVAVAVAPLLTLRRLRRMDIPSTLRVVE
jgi:putative ABC transport system permease protein